MTANNPFTITLARVDNSRVADVGGKNASLGELISNLRKSGIRVPGGFATTASAYWHFLDASNLREAIGHRLSLLEKRRATLEKTGAAIRRLIL
jgi:pyruvate,water dikinase